MSEQTKLVEDMDAMGRHVEHIRATVQVQQTYAKSSLMADGAQVRIQVEDNAMGIAPEAKVRLFAHGFTTRKDGHGFGLHSSALVARMLGAV